MLAKPDRAQFEKFFRRRGVELYTFLDEFVRKENTEENSLILSGWSLGSVFLLAFLAHADDLALKNPTVHLDRFVKRVLFYGLIYL